MCHPLLHHITSRYKLWVQELSPRTFCGAAIDNYNHHPTLFYSPLFLLLMLVLQSEAQ